MKNAIVTGGAGFIGSHLADRLLKMGYIVRIIDNESTGVRDNVPSDAEYFQGDVRRPGDLEAVFDGETDLVCHVAGQASTIRSFDDPREDIDVNLVGTVNVVDKCIQHSVPRMLFASSMTVYGASASLPCLESDLPSPISYYGISKYAAERFVHASANRSDLDFQFATTAFRMFNVYGDRQSLDNPYQGVMAIFMSRALRGEPIDIFGDGEQTRDFVHIDDVVDAWIRSIESESTWHRSFNLGNGSRISMNQLVRKILTAAGRDEEAYDIRYSAERPGDQKHMQADVRMLREALHWQPSVDLDSGLKRTLQWAREAEETSRRGTNRG